MDDRTDELPDFEEIEENHDGRTMALLVLSAATICGVLVAGGFAAVGLLFHSAPPDAVAFTDSNVEVRKARSATVPAETPDQIQSDLTEPVTIPEIAESKPVIVAASEPILSDSLKDAAPEPIKQPEPTVADLVSPTSVAGTGIADTAEASTADTPDAGSTTEPPESKTQTHSSTKGTPLSYHWNPGEIQAYTVSMATTIDEQKHSVSGTVELTFEEQPPNVDTATGDTETSKSVTGTGTGFVVSADGFLITCAHVIQGADRIAVEIQGKTHIARVVAVEPDDDLALLRIDASGLHPLSLADSGQVRLGEEVRAIGFPLSTVLGNGIKVTRGIVAGIIEKAEGQRFLIDAAVNPGNSGGPVVNGRGQVLGVASSKLVGLELTRVGFCVPAERAVSLLKANQVKPLDGASDKDLDGPSLVEAVAPSVALISVTIDVQKVSEQLVQIKSSGSFRTRNEPTDQRRLTFSFPNMTFNSGSLNVDTFGRVASFDSPNQLPFLAGPMSLLTIHQFDQAGRSSWTVRNRIKVTVQQDNSPFGRVRPRIPVPRLPRFGRPGIDPFAPKTLKEFEAVEVRQYRIVSDSDDRVVLEKTFTLTTLDNDETPYFRITGKGEVIFSRRLGLIESFEFEHLYEKNDGKESVKIPVKIAVKRQAADVVAKRKREAAIAQAEVEHANAVKEANKVIVPAGERLDTLLKTLRDEAAKGGYPSSQLSSLSKFEVLPDRRDEVEALLVGLLESEQYLTVTAALGALQTWGTPNSIPAINAQLKHSKFPVVQAAVKTLGAMPDERSVAPLLETVRKNQLARHDARGALVKIGRVAEEPVIALLFDGDLQIFQAACDILKELGGENSVEPLESIANGTDNFRKSYARRSLDSVNARVAAARTVAEAGGDEAVVDLSAAKVEAVLKAMNTPADASGYARTSSIMQLGDVTDYKRDELEDALLKSLDDVNFAVQHQGMMALQKRATKRSIARLLKLFLDPESKLQFMAAQTLQKTGVGVDGERMLVAEVSKSATKIQKAILSLLTEIGSPASLEKLDELASATQASSTQYAAARAAARIRLRADMPVSG